MVISSCSLQSRLGGDRESKLLFSDASTVLAVKNEVRYTYRSSYKRVSCPRPDLVPSLPATVPV